MQVEIARNFSRTVANFSDFHVGRRKAQIFLGFVGSERLNRFQLSCSAIENVHRTQTALRRDSRA